MASPKPSTADLLHKAVKLPWPVLNSQRILAGTQSLIESGAIQVQMMKPQAGCTYEDYRQSLGVVACEFQKLLQANAVDVEPKHLTLMANALYYVDSEQFQLVGALWEFGVRAKERNALFSTANYLMTQDQIGGAQLVIQGLLRHAVKLDHPLAAYNLGLMLSKDANNLTEAINCLQLACQSSVQEAHCVLARLHLDRHAKFDSIDELNAALEVLRAGVDKNDAASMLQMANMFAEGQFVSQNYQQAVELWHQAAVMGKNDEVASDTAMRITASKATYNLGVACFMGQMPGVSRPHYIQAMEYWQLSYKLDAGNVAAWLNVAHMHLFGISEIKRNTEQAEWHYQQLLLNAEQKLGVTPSDVDAGDSESQIVSHTQQFVDSADALLNLCSSALDMSQDSYDAGKSIDQMLNDISQQLNENSQRKQSLFDMFMAPENADHERAEQGKQVRVHALREREQSAIKNRWRHIENLLY